MPLREANHAWDGLANDLGRDGHSLTKPVLAHLAPTDDYKSAWLAFVYLPLLLTGQTPAYTVLFACIFLSYVVGDALANPFRKRLSQENMVQESSSAKDKHLAESD